MNERMLSATVIGREAILCTQAQTAFNIRAGAFA